MGHPVCLGFTSLAPHDTGGNACYSVCRHQCTTQLITQTLSSGFSPNATTFLTQFTPETPSLCCSPKPSASHLTSPHLTSPHLTSPNRPHLILTAPVQLATVTGNEAGMVRIHLDDQMDAKSLLGAYVCTAVPGEFAWQPGPLTQVYQCGACLADGGMGPLTVKSLGSCSTMNLFYCLFSEPQILPLRPFLLHQAVVEGRWVVIEDANMAPPDVLAALVPLLESRTLALPSRGEVIEAAPGFQLLATVTSAPGSGAIGEGSGGGGAYGSSQMVKVRDSRWCPQWPC